MNRRSRTLARVIKGPVGGMLACLLLAMLLGGVAAAQTSPSPEATPTEVPSEAPSETPSEVPSVEPSETPEAPEKDAGESKAPTKDSQDQDHGGPVHTAGDCQAVVAGVQGQLPAGDVATGLAQAIWNVESNCETNLHAPGLLNALGHRVANWQRHQAPEGS